MPIYKQVGVAVTGNSYEDLRRSPVTYNKAYNYALLFLQLLSLLA